MTQMSSVTRTTATSTKETATAIGSLAALADNLNGSVARFRLPAAQAAPAPASADFELAAR